MTDADYMLEAFKEARKAAKLDEVPVGAVIVNPADGQIIARAFNHTEHNGDPTGHAEILAIRKACRKLKLKRLWGLDLYVTVEPCTMCAAAISFARIRRVIFGTTDPKGGAVISGVQFYCQPICYHMPHICPGVLEEECANLMREFFRNKRHKNSRSKTP